MPEEFEVYKKFLTKYNKYKLKSMRHQDSSQSHENVPLSEQVERALDVHNYKFLFSIFIKNKKTS